MNFLKKAVCHILPRNISHLAANISAPISTRTFSLFSSGIKLQMLNFNYLNSSKLLLQPENNIILQVAGFKVKGRLKRRCKDCYFVVRKERLYVICKTHPRHKQMAMKKKEHNSWILTDATQSKIRPF